jgi:hypothetical protein
VRSFIQNGATGDLPKALQYVYNLGILASQILSTLLGGDPDETFSSRTGKACKRGSWVARKILSPALDVLFLDENHAVKSIEFDEGSKEVWRWG